ncbi:MAG: serine/threonine protein kinase [Betaproteobacteria bacterium]|nr:serine/threonine protein kinase [Betaproteobacteria bacterium]
MSTPAPASIGKYEIIKVLGTGSSATVYLARDTFSQAQIALKVIDPGVLKGAADSQSLRAQFQREASLAGRLQHPHIVAILDAVVNEEAGYIAMEYVPGGSLAPRVKPQDLFSVEDAIQVGFKCCGALDYAFRQGIVHRDIKPANIMVVKDTDIKIADFGAAHLRKNETVVTMNVGSPAYMSPEQISGQTLTHQSDMFSVGIVLYELLTGQRPFAGATLDAVLNNVMKVDPAPPSKVRPELPPELDAIVLKALQKTPAARYTTWAEFALDLAKVGKLSFKEQTIRDSEKFEALRKVELLQRFNDAELWELVHAGRG